MLAPGVATPSFRVLTTRPDYTQKFSGLELTATKRLSHNWMMRGEPELQRLHRGLRRRTLRQSDAGPSGRRRCVRRTGRLPRRPVRAAVGRLRRLRQRLHQLEVAVQPHRRSTSLRGTSTSAPASPRRQGYRRARCARRSPVSTPARSTSCSIRSATSASTTSTSSTSASPRTSACRRASASRSRAISSTPRTSAPSCSARRSLLQNANGTAGGSRSAGWRITELQAPRVWRLGGKFTF